MNESLSAYHLSSNPGKTYEPAKGNFFEFIIEDLDDLLKAGVDVNFNDESDRIHNGQEVIRLSVASVSIPHFTQEPITIRRGNSVSKYAGSPSFDDGELVIDDLVGADGKSVLEAWQRLSYDVTTDKAGLAANYKKNATLVEYTSDWKQVRYWELVGCWISGLREDAYNKESTSELRKVTATIQYDRAIPHMPD